MVSGWMERMGRETITGNHAIELKLKMCDICTECEMIIGYS